MTVIHTPTKVNDYNTFFSRIFLSDKAVAGEPEEPVSL